MQIIFAKTNLLCMVSIYTNYDFMNILMFIYLVYKYYQLFVRNNNLIHYKLWKFECNFGENLLRHVYLIDRNVVRKVVHTGLPFAFYNTSYIIKNKKSFMNSISTSTIFTFVKIKTLIWTFMNLNIRHLYRWFVYTLLFEYLLTYCLNQGGL